jgi:uncharacterized protein YecE (DUF72 family)
VNNAFYRLPERSTFERWRERTPPDFVVAVKVSRYLTHVKRLRDPAEPVARFLGPRERARPQARPGPAAVAADVAFRRRPARRALHGVSVLGTGRGGAPPPELVRRVDPFRAGPTQRRAVLGRPRGPPVTPLWRTADFGYLRLHEGTASPRPRYGRQALKTWRDRLASAFPGGEDVFVYFNNDHGAAAVINAHEWCRSPTKSRRSDVTADISARS